MGRIAERHREGLADWLDSRELVAEPLDPAESAGLPDLNRTVSSPAANRTGTRTVLDLEPAPFDSTRHEASPAATDGQELPPDA